MLSLLVWAGLAAAQDQDTVTITASGAERRAFDTPFAVGVVGAEELRGAGPMVNLSEVLVRVPGLVVNNRSNYAQDLQIHSRGFGARASFGVRGLRLYADGIPASGPDGQGQVTNFDLAGAARMEVLRGPFSALYGNSSGGVISLVSEAPRERRISLDADVGSDGLRQGRVGVAAPLGGGFSVRAQVSHMQTDGFRLQSSAERTLGNVRLGWEQDSDRVVLVLNSINQPAKDALGLTRAQFQADPDQTTGVALPQEAPGQADRFNTRKNTWQDQAGLSWRPPLCRRQHTARKPGGGLCRQTVRHAVAVHPRGDTVECEQPDPDRQAARWRYRLRPQLPGPRRPPRVALGHGPRPHGPSGDGCFG
jgi:iron complex outermembrane receptor protein